MDLRTSTIISRIQKSTFFLWFGSVRAVRMSGEKDFPMTKTELRALEDLKTWGVNLVADFVQSYGKPTQDHLLEKGYIQILTSPVGEVLALGSAGYRHFDYKFQWYKPTETAVMDQLALRLCVQVMEARGYNQPFWRSRTVARVVSARGIPTYLLVKYRDPSASVVKNTVAKLLADGIEDNASIIIFRNNAHRIQGATKLSHHPVELETPPWATVWNS